MRSSGGFGSAIYDAVVGPFARTALSGACSVRRSRQDRKLQLARLLPFYGLSGLILLTVVLLWAERCARGFVPNIAIK
jgi:hypothetical protein